MSSASLNSGAHSCSVFVKGRCSFVSSAIRRTRVWWRKSAVWPKRSFGLYQAPIGKMSDLFGSDKVSKTAERSAWPPRA